MLFFRIGMMASTIVGLPEGVPFLVSNEQFDFSGIYVISLYG